ncbi:MAG: enoyl-CoA hydratase/isomerase family protein [Actinomycetota bacterium]
MASLERSDDVYLLTLGDDENRFNAESVASINACLDEVERADGPRALVTTGLGKFYSNGLDLDWMGSGAIEDPTAFVGDVLRLLGRVLVSPVPTVAAVNGHAFAGGAMLAVAHDRLVMRRDRGFWCVNEVLLGMQFAPGMLELLKARLPQPTRHRALVSAERFGGEAAVAAGIATDAVDESQVVPTAMEMAAQLAATAGDTAAGIKRALYPEAFSTLSSGLVSG